METIRCGEALLRSSQPLLSFVTPATRTSSTITRQCRAQRQWQASRSFTTTQRRRQEDDGPPPPRNHPSTPPSSQYSFTDDISSMLDSTLNFDKGTPTAPDSRTSHFHSRDAQARNPPSRVLARHMEKAKASQGASMVDDLLNTLTRNDPLKASRPNASLSDIGSMIAPYSQNDHLTRDQPELESAPVKLGPTVGRTVNVNPARGMDVGRAFRQLEILCARNHVRKDVMRQRFHERPGLKRKRLKSERWRRNFKENFKGTVALVQKMRKQGW